MAVIFVLKSILDEIHKAYYVSCHKTAHNSARDSDHEVNYRTHLSFLLSFVFPRKDFYMKQTPHGAGTTQPPNCRLSAIRNSRRHLHILFY